MWDYLLDALLDTLKLVPWLLIMHVLIEVFEYHAVSKIKLNKALKGPFAPLIGGVCGVLPQCGFGVVAADLYSRKSIRLGTMIAVFIATSDEAIPIMLSSPSADSVIKLCVLLGCKLVAALIAGYALNAILSKRELTEIDESEVVIRGCHHHELGEHTHGHGHAHEHEHEHGHALVIPTDTNVIPTDTNVIPTDTTHVIPTEAEESSIDPSTALGVTAEKDSSTALGVTNREAATHVIPTDTLVIPTEAEESTQASRGVTDTAKKRKKFDFKCFVLHPLLHTLTVAGYILIVNVLFAVILYFVGESALENALMQAKFFQPFIAALVGLIPNCASSVIIAQLFARGSITLGAAFAGLSVNAGLGLAVLLRKNRPVKNTFMIAGGLYLYSCVLGVLLTLIP